MSDPRRVHHSVRESLLEVRHAIAELQVARLELEAIEPTARSSEAQQAVKQPLDRIGLARRFLGSAEDRHA